MSMRIKLILLVILLGIAVGLLTGILDSFIHYTDLQGYKFLNIIVILLFLSGTFIATLIYRNKLTDGYLNYWQAFIKFFIIGTIASVIISVIRFVYLKYIAVIDIQAILDETEKTMLDHYSQYGDELIDNRLSFIEFSYDPVISSTFYFLYYVLYGFIFGFLAAAFLRRIDRNIAI